MTGPGPDAGPGGLPAGLERYKRTEEFTLGTIPAGLKKDHSTKAGTWGLIHVTAGSLRYTVTDSRRAGAETLLTADGPPGVVEPTIVHHVTPRGDGVRFFVEFWRAPS